MTDPREQALDYLSRLGSHPATAFNENGVAGVVRAILAELGLEHRRDAFGNIIAKVAGTGSTVNPLAIVAHMDHPGFEITGSHPDGYIAKAMGGVPQSSFEAGVPVQVLLPNGSRINGATAGKHGEDSERQVLIRLEQPQDLEPPLSAVFDLVDFELDGQYIRMRAVDDLARSGKVRYIGCSNYNAWQITKALWISDREGLARYDCLQPQYNLIQRDIETEILPLCADQGLGVIPWSPLGGGFLTGKYKKGVDWERQTRFGDDPDSNFWKQYLHDRNYEILEVLNGVARDLGISNARVAIGWLLRNPQVTSVIIGARTLAQLEDNMGVADWNLPEAAWKTLDDASRHPEPYPNWFISMVHGFVNNDTE